MTLQNSIVTNKQKAIGWIKAIRPKFLISYIILGFGGIVIGIINSSNKLNAPLLILSLCTILLAGIGVHFRDEASDWLAGYDKIAGGVGVIREGILKVRSLQITGRVLTAISLGLVILHTIIIWQLIYIVVPIVVVILASNFITEKISLGHEIGPAFAYSMALLWVFLGQGWIFTFSTLFL
ncbi:MAG: hypothetical protein P8Y70_09265 [Candidatus Lokiarchaeota archaeon]